MYDPRYLSPHSQINRRNNDSTSNEMGLGFEADSGPELETKVYTNLPSLTPLLHTSTSTRGHVSMNHRRL